MPNRWDAEESGKLGTVGSFSISYKEMGRVRVCAGHYRGETIVRIWPEEGQKMESAAWLSLVEMLTSIALRCPRVRDHVHVPSGDGVDLADQLAVGYVEIRLSFNDFLINFGKAMATAGLYPNDCRIEGLGPNWVRIGIFVQLAVEGR